MQMICVKICINKLKERVCDMNNKLRSVGTLRNIGDARVRAFNRVGVETLDDLAHYYPRAYQNRGNTRTLSEIRELIRDGAEGPFSTVLTVGSAPRVHLIRRGMSLLKFRAFDEDSVCEITFFNQNFLKDTFVVGASFRFWGRFTMSKSVLSLSSPLFEPCVNEADLPPIVPVYPLTQGLSQKIVQTAVSDSLRTVIPELEEVLPAGVLGASSLPSSAYAVRNIHFPESEEALEKAKKRLVFDELFVASCALGMSGGRKSIRSSSRISNGDISAFLSSLPFEMTGAQKKATQEIISDMQAPYAMNRMLTGDVGSGKTAVASAAAFACLNNQMDCLFMVPTEILANQHYKDLSELFSKVGFEVLLVTGHTSASDRRYAAMRLASDTPVLVIGTHALLSEDIVPSRLGLVIIDEQHRFGAMQRAALADKAKGVGTLTMSATPIPRSLSLVMYGTLDVSRIDELPAGRKPVDTFVVNEGYRARLNSFIKKQAEEGHQVYIVCPAIEELPEKKHSDNLEEAADIMLFDIPSPIEEALPMKAAAVYAEDIKRALPELSVALVHGKMKAREREEIMGEFCRGEIDVLVSTTVIEVGVNVPNATLMVVENAERFGLSQLHQLRGRVGRGDAKSYFILVSDAKGDKAKERLRTIKNCRNGFDIAEADLRLRGPGDLFSENGVMRQHGDSSLTLSAGCTDAALIKMASDMANAVLERDRLLENEENAPLRRACEKFISKSENTLN